jgi:hypothetical protein
MNQEIANAIVKWGDHEDLDNFLVITDETITKLTRWHAHVFQIHQDKRDGKYWRIEWMRGATEMQDEGPENIIFYEVVPKEVTVVKFMRVE